jgi:hypothetical protein
MKRRKRIFIMKVQYRERAFVKIKLEPCYRNDDPSKDVHKYDQKG